VIPSTAYVYYRPDGPAQVDASLRLTGRSQIQCSTYDDRPAILSVNDAHVSVSVTVPDPAKVTVDDLDVAVRLAEALAAYIADLRGRMAAQDETAADAA
jgi:hypothetical protein